MAKRKRHDEELLAQCVARVLAGESATAVSRETDIPYTTLLGRVHWQKTGYEPASKRRQQVQMTANQPAEGSDVTSTAATATTATTATRHAAPPLAEVDEMEILRVMARMQHADVRVRRRDVLNKANEMKAPEAAECGIQWFQRFRERHPEVSGTGTNLVLDESMMEQLLGSLEEEVETTGDDNAEQEEKEEEELLTPSQRAVQELQSCYATQLDAEDMVEAFDIMADPVVARVFLVIAPGQLRDLWLKLRIDKMRDAENGAEAAKVSAT